MPSHQVAWLLFTSLGDLREPAASKLDRLALHRIEALSQTLLLRGAVALGVRSLRVVGVLCVLQTGVN